MPSAAHSLNPFIPFTPCRIDRSNNPKRKEKEAERQFEIDTVSRPASTCQRWLQRPIMLLHPHPALILTPVPPARTPSAPAGEPNPAGKAHQD